MSSPLRQPGVHGRRARPAWFALRAWLGSAVFLSVLAAGPAQAATFVVNSTGDQADNNIGNGVCSIGPPTNACTLRAAIAEVLVSGAPRIINFSIGAGGVQTITLTAALPFISQPVTIDGTTQPLYPGTPIIELSAAACGAAGALDLRGGSSGSTIRGLVINGCPSRAIRLLGTSNNVIAGNFLGTNVAGTAAVANNTGIYIGGSATATNNNRIGGTTAADRNVISGNTADGVQINGGTGGAANNRIEGNYIGLDVSGTLDLGNGGQGVGVFGANTNTNNVVGGTALNAGNVISGNGNDGVLIANAGTTGTLVQGNRIGTNAAGTAAIPNLRGVEFDAATAGNTIGGTAAGAANRIAYNTFGGVEFTLSAGTGNTILSNEIYSNGSLGIDLGENGVTTNDSGDGDSGPNALLNFPDITAASVSGGSVSVSFQLDVPAGSYWIEFFKNPSGADPTGYGEGQILAGARIVTHPGGGAVPFTHAVPGAPGDILTATTTFCTDGAVCAAFGSTSEFSATELVTCCSLSTAEVPGSTVTVTGAGQFEMRFNTAAGGGVDQFYDLALDPARGFDLVGSIGNASHDSLFLEELEQGGGASYWTNERVVAASQKLDLLEATPTRVKVRAECFYGDFPGGNFLAGLKAIGDYSVYPSGRLALRWNRMAASNVPYTSDWHTLTVHYKNPADPLSNWTTYSQTGLVPTNGTEGTGSQQFLLSRIEQPQAATDFLLIRAQDWPAADTAQNRQVAVPDETLQLAWRDSTSTTITGGTSQAWHYLTYFRPTTLGAGASPWLDTAVTTRSTDYRTHPAGEITINGGKGFAWSDTVENTGAGDWFNEAEAVYPLELHQTLGLDFDLDGSTRRYSPFFKIRGWRSLVESPTVTLEGTALRKDVDYKAAVKPLSRAHFTNSLRWHCTLDDTSVTNTCSPSGIDLDVGGSGGVSGVTMVPARYGFGAAFDANTDSISAPSNVLAEFDPGGGAVEFWYQPNQNHTASGPLVFWRTNSADDCFVFEKTGTNALQFTIRKGAASNCTSGGTTYQVSVPSGSYSWRAKDWVHLRTTWTNAFPGRIAIWVNGVELSFNTGYNASTVTSGSTLVFGGCSAFCPLGSTGNADGILDELSIYGGPSEPASIAHAGRVGAADEYLADSGFNYPLGLARVDASRRGRYLYFGADSKFLGLNVSLATAGAGVADSDVVWQYWRGGSGAWVTLSPTDGTRSFKQTGTVFWADPSGWTPMSVSGGPDLYYVRAYLPATATADYTTIPVERVIKTDILLFQYCGDITAAAQTFSFGVPPTTEVTLASLTATAGDASVRLDWRTESELRNLGFHVYRSLSQAGPWTRLTSSLVPGLGSSAVGQAYSYRDTGLVNGTRYFYRLEDVDASSKATSHGPVSAVPLSGAAASGAPGSQPPAGGQDQKKAAAAGCPDWVVAAYGAMVGSAASTASLTCTRHGDPEAVSFGVVSRDARSATVELRTGGFYALREATGGVRVFVPGFDFPQDEQALALPFRRGLVDAVVGRRVQLGGVRALEQQAFKGVVPSALGKAEMQVSRDGTVRPWRRVLTSDGLRLDARRMPGADSRADLVTLLPSQFQGETKSAVLELKPLRYDAQRSRLVLAKRLLVKLLFTGREAGESGRGAFGRRQKPGQPASGEVLARLYASERGLYQASFEQVFPGQARGIATSQLRLEQQGEAVAFHVEPTPDRFGPGSRLYFFADRTAGSTGFTGEVAYELLRSREGVQMGIVVAAPGPTVVATPSIGTHGFEANKFYQPGLLEAQDLWQWDGLASGWTRAKSFTLTGVEASGTADLDVDLQGASESGNAVDHHVSVSVNGTLVGEAQFAGKKPYRVSLSVAASLLREGANELSLTNVADTGVSSYVFLDKFVIVHPQSSLVAGERWEGEWLESGSVGVSGFSAVSGPVRVVDVTGLAGPDGAGTSGATGTGTSGTAGPAWLTGFESGAGSVRFRAEAGRRYWVGGDSALFSPRVSSVLPSTLKSAVNQADYLLITPQSFLAAAEPLLARRQDQGLTARAVSLEEIAAEFGHGQPSAEAIKGFVAYAYQSWAWPSPRYVLLLGDSTYDPRNFIGSSRPSPLPALWTKTSYLWTVSDPLLGAVNGDDSLPDLAIGRLPATSVEQAQKLIAKLIAWEESGQGLTGPAVLVADNADIAGDFEADAEDIRASYFGDREAKVLKLSELGAGTRPAIQAALNAGLSHLDYVGHGGAAVWASENVWNSWDAASLQAQSRQPLLVTMNCLNGYFVAPAFDSLSESLLKAEGRGAVAAFSPSGLSLDGPAHQYHRALMAELVSGRHARLGDAILAAQKAYAQTGLMPELLTVYQLLGDPATAIR